MRLHPITAAGLLGLAAVAALAGCAAAPLPEEPFVERIRQAARDERADRFAAAAAGYEAAAGLTANDRIALTARYRAAQSADRAGDTEHALALFFAIAAEHPGTGEAGRSLYDAAQLLRRVGREPEAIETFFRLVRQEPDSVMVDLGLRRLRQIYDDRDDLAALDGRLGAELDAAGEQPVRVSLLYVRALVREDLGRIADALGDLDVAHVVCPYPTCGFWDDIPWQAARIAHEAGDSVQAIAYLDELLTAQEDSWILGWFYSVFFDDARLLKAEIQADELDDPAAAAETYLTLDTVTASTFADDGLYRAALLYLDRLDEPERGCDLLRELLDEYADSNRRTAAEARLAQAPCR